MPVLDLYSKYKDPPRLAEFRLFNLNLCNMGCKGCFYKKDGNTFGTYDPAIKLATELQSHGYKLETCYLLPTDIFDNPQNILIFDSPPFIQLISMFAYVGIASTLLNDNNWELFDRITTETHGQTGVELQVNLVIDKIFDDDYIAIISQRIHDITSRYPDIVLNLAVNVGFRYTAEELNQIHYLVNLLSVDKIVEVNFTFLYNETIGPNKRRQMMIESYHALRDFSDKYVSDGDNRFNTRTLLRKPSFTFKDGNIYSSPIFPFDEFVFLHNDKYKLSEPTMDGFLTVLNTMDQENTPILAECDTCDNLSTCYGKGFFVIANNMNLPCFLKESTK